jgi:alpha-1,3-glucosyltransferase
MVDRSFQFGVVGALAATAGRMTSNHLSPRIDGHRPPTRRQEEEEHDHDVDEEKEEDDNVGAVDDRVWLAGSFAVAGCAKVLLFPSYYSTDLFVHRHWKAITRNLPLQDWYWGDRHVDTVHTLDYPPGFAWVECGWANNPATQWILFDVGKERRPQDDQCLQLVSDGEVDQPLSSSCIAFLRSTVIASDLVLWWGAWRVASVLSAAEEAEVTTVRRNRKWTLFLLTVFHPGLLWLDHVHFQYNGMLLGVLLLSLSHLLQEPQTAKDTSNHLLASALWFACLLNLKHLYLTLSVWYFCYLLRAYCFVQDQFRWRRLIRLGSMTVLALALPWLPLLAASPEPAELVRQILRRLFPFQRGLLHDYWAANAWALYAAAGKIASYLSRTPGVLDEAWVKPRHAAILTLLALLVGGRQAWRAAAERSRTRLLLSLVYSALASFQTAYHVHEKAIMTALIPMLAFAFLGTDNKPREVAAAPALRRLLWETTAWGIVGLFPLLFEARELTLKLASYGAYMAALHHVCFETHKESDALTGTTKWWIRLNLVGVVLVIGTLEFVPTSAWGRYEFAPLALTSISCALALVVATVRLTVLMLRLG